MFGLRRFRRQKETRDDSEEFHDEYESWKRALDVELAAGDITQERYERDLEFYRGVYDGR